MDRLGFNSGNSGILESTREYLGITRGSYRNDLGMTQEYLGDSGRVRDMTMGQGCSTVHLDCFLGRMMVILTWKVKTICWIVKVVALPTIISCLPLPLSTHLQMFLKLLCLSCCSAITTYFCTEYCRLVCTYSYYSFLQ